MSDEDFIKELTNFISVYKKYKLDGPLVKHDHFGMHEETVLTRESIHDLIEDARERNINFDTEELKQLDKEWQSYVRTNRAEGFALVDLNREQNPRSLWWFWVDQIDSLTDEELATL